VRRLFSSFARGWPAVGLLLMRLVAGGSLIQQAVVKLHAGHAVDAWLPAVLVCATAVLLLVGLWTPIACVAAVLIELWCIFSGLEDTRICILLAALCAALALLGPGAWSIDARLFGWKRIDFRNGKS
jgi:putative oxidoreductase